MKAKLINSLFMTFSLFLSMCFQTEGRANQHGPLRHIPSDLHHAFTLDGTIPVFDYYKNDSYSADHPLIYSVQEIQSYLDKIQLGQTHYYGVTDTYLYTILDWHVQDFEGKEVGIIGSTIPWYEAVVLAYNGLPVTIEYNKIISEHPTVHTMTLTEYDLNPIKFDYILSISSFEHDGLGRYGDPINPFGDLEAMQKAKKMLKKDGMMILAVPVGEDAIYWNAHRVYGKIRFPLLVAGWEIVASEGFEEGFTVPSYIGHQPVFLLRPLP